MWGKREGEREGEKVHCSGFHKIAIQVIQAAFLSRSYGPPEVIVGL